MASTGLKVAGGAVKAGDVATGAGIGVAQGATSAAFSVARGSTALGLGIAQACVRIPAALFGVAGLERASEALHRADEAIAGAQEKSDAAMMEAHEKSSESMTRARASAGSSMDNARQNLTAIANQNGLYLRLILGKDTTQVVLAASELVQNFAEPLNKIPKADLYRAAQAWATLQDAGAGKTCQSNSLEVKLPEDSERWMRYAVAAFGAYRAGRLIDDPSAARRERKEAYRVARASIQLSSAQSASVRHSLQAPPADQDQPKCARADCQFRRQRQTRDKGKHGPLCKRECFVEPMQSTCVEHLQAKTSDDVEILPNESPTSADQHESIQNSITTEHEDEIAQLLWDLPEEKGGDADEDAGDYDDLLVELVTTSEERRKKTKALKIIRAEEKKARKQARIHMRAQLKATRMQWKSVAGRGTSALTCAGIPPSGIEVTVFEEANRPLPGEPHVPGQMVAVDNEKGCVVVALRGSSCLRDALTDLDCKPEALTLCGREGFAHGGMLRAAQKLDETLAAAVEDALTKLRGPPRVLVVGHSLGAGVAALLTALWCDVERFPGAEIKCLAFACPQVLDSELAVSMSCHTTSYVCGDDCVPCLSLATALDLRDALVLLTNPEAKGLGPDLSSLEVLAAFERGETDRLIDSYRTVRRVVGSAPQRLYPAGCLVKLAPGCVPHHASHAAVDEMIVTRDMVLGHLPRRYVAAVQEVAAGGGAVETLWVKHSNL